VVREDAREPGEHEEDDMDMLSVRQVRTLRCPLSGEGEEQGWLQALIEDRQQAPIEERSQA
jgi:hypothetical protein